MIQKKRLHVASLTDPIDYCLSIGSGCTITRSHLFHVFIVLLFSWIVVDPSEVDHNKS